MATGTSKTRVAMALIDVFLRAGQAQNVLFLADRDALVVDAVPPPILISPRRALLYVY
jgi:type I restriction enzyme, R subunit